MKRPSFQFYVGDWQSNSNLRRCTFAEKGIWLDVMCLMHDGEQYGVLRWPLKEIAQAVGCKLADLKALVTKGVLKGADTGDTCQVFIYTPRSGGKDGEPVTLIPEQPGPLWYSSRMVKDEYVSKNRGKGTRFGDDKPPKNDSGKSSPIQRVGTRHGIEPIQREEDGPSVFNLLSSTSSEGREPSSEDLPVRKRDTGYPLLFQVFHKAYPATNGPKKSSFEQWKRVRGDENAPEIMAGLAGYLRNHKRLVDAGEFAPEHPYPQKWLKEHRWKDYLASADGEDPRTEHASAEAIIAGDPVLKRHVDYLRAGGRLTDEALSYVALKLGDNWESLCRTN